MGNVAGDTSYLASGLYEEIFAEAIIAYSDAGVMKNLVNDKPIMKADTASWQVANKGTNVINSADVSAVTDGTQISAAIVNTDKKTATLAPYSVRTDVYDDTKYSNISDQAGYLGPLLGNASGAFVDKTIGALFSAVTNNVGTSTAGLTVDNMYAALAYLDEAGAPGQPSFVGKPGQIRGTYGLLNDLVTSTQFGGSPDLQNPGLQNAWVDRIAGIDLYKSREVEVHDTNMAYGCVFVRDAFGLAAKNFDSGQPFWLEMSREASYQRDEWYSHLFLGVIELVDDYGVYVDTRFQ
jgi:hypothetical protein